MILLLTIQSFLLYTPADIDECKTSNNTCIDESHCRNTDGLYECFCPDGQSGNGTLEGGCHRRDIVTKVAIGKSLSISHIYFLLKLVTCVVFMYIFVTMSLIKNELIDNGFS